MGHVDRDREFSERSHKRKGMSCEGTQLPICEAQCDVYMTQYQECKVTLQNPTRYKERKEISNGTPYKECKGISKHPFSHPVLDLPPH